MNTPSGGGSPSAVWTSIALLDWSSGYFREKGIATARVDSEVLLAHALGCRRIDLYLQFDRPLNNDELASYRELVRERAQRTPVAYLVGEVGFWNLTLAVRPGCLIPRPDTETLVEECIEAIRAVREARNAPQAPLRLLELGTGSGAIPLAVCGDCEHLRWVTVDLSGTALDVARENMRRHTALLTPRDNEIHLIQAREFQFLAESYRPDLIVSNPPYIPSGAIESLEPEVAQGEPRLALDGGADGLGFHRLLIEQAATGLTPGGRLLLEIGFDQECAVREMLSFYDALRLVSIKEDLGGQCRVAHAEKAA